MSFIIIFGTLSFPIVMHELQFHICDNLKHWHVNDDKCLGFSDCVVSHFHVIARPIMQSGCMSIVVFFRFLIWVLL